MSGISGGCDVPIDGEGLGEEQVRRILERRRDAAAERATAREKGVAVIVCLIGGERFAVPLAAVAEVMPAVPPVRVPMAPAGLAGLISGRGVIYNLIDPALPLGVPSGQSAHALLLRGPVPRVALRIDEAVEVAEIAGIASADGGLTETRFFADGTRVELIAVDRLVAALLVPGRTDPT